MRTLPLLTLVITAGLSAGALAATQVIHQQGRAFSVRERDPQEG